MAKEDRKIYVVGGYRNYANWMNGVCVDSMDKSNLVVFTGGEDVTPALYDSIPHPTSNYNWRRDERERIEFDRAQSIGLPMVGICRGSQFLCVMSGGALIQHQQHPGTHDIQTYDGDTIHVTSTHHQRQFPWARKHPVFTLIGWCHEGTSPFSYFGDGSQAAHHQEVEIAFYRETNALAIQSHPEFCWPCREDWHNKYIEYLRKLLDKQIRGRI